MAWSRTYLQVHWLLDVLAGSLLGAGVALLVFAFFQLMLRRRAPARQPPGED
jgi:undecaprenyl-diphosphatase